MVYESILGTIGHTPIVRLNKLARPGVELFVKVESFNPMGSVKDRLALGIIEAAEQDGTLKPGQTVVEATSGNTGIGLAMVCAVKGYPLVVTMAESFSVERRRLMRFLGARVVLTPASEKGSGMVAKARELADKHGWFLTRQFENEANPDMHSRTTAEEILAEFPPSSGGVAADNNNNNNNNKFPLDYWVSGFGTGGTIKGVARVLKARSPGTKIIAAEPDNSPLLGSGLMQKYNEDGSPAGSHAAFRPHLMQGWTPDFIPKLADDVIRAEHVDQIQPVAGADAMRMTRELATKEGIFCGVSAGATLAAALEIAKTAPEGSRILAMLPDTGERYLSTPLFADIAEAMNEDELAISNSTERYRFGGSSAAPPPPPAAKPAVPAPEPSDEALAHFDDVVSGKDDEAVVVFALEWCEFCWSVRKLFAAAGIEHRTVLLDGPDYRADDRGGDVRRAIAKRTGKVTIPQIFVGGRHVGGATETFDEWNSGALQKQLAEMGRPVKNSDIENAYGFLPKWLHPR